MIEKKTLQLKKETKKEEKRVENGKSRIMAYRNCMLEIRKKVL